MASDINCAAWLGLFRDDAVGEAALADSSDEPVDEAEVAASQRETVRCVQKAIVRYSTLPLSKRCRRSKPDFISDVCPE